MTSCSSLTPPSSQRILIGPSRPMVNRLQLGIFCQVNEEKLRNMNVCIYFQISVTLCCSLCKRICQNLNTSRLHPLVYSSGSLQELQPNCHVQFSFRVMQHSNMELK